LKTSEVFAAVVLDEKRSCPDQIGQLRTLVRAQKSVDLLQGFEYSGAKALFALNAKVSTFTCFRRVECFSDDGVGKGRHCAAAVDLGLGALCLELIQDPCQFGDLAIVQI
jgi:hypothetical protein